MNNDKRIKDLKERNDKLKMQYTYRDIRCIVLEKQLEAYENMRKEAIEYIDNHKEQLHHSFDEPDWNYLLNCNPDDLLNILNKVGDSDE